MFSLSLLCEVLLLSGAPRVSFCALLPRFFLSILVDVPRSRSHPCRTTAWGELSDQPARMHFFRQNLPKPPIQPVYSEILLYSSLKNRTLLCSARLLARKIFQYFKIAQLSPTRIKIFSKIKNGVKSDSKKCQKIFSLMFWHHKLNGFRLKPQPLVSHDY